ncbi:MAG: hypothetical protein ACXWM7_01505 [Parachlamydiaceae bacterium]
MAISGLAVMTFAPSVFTAIGLLALVVSTKENLYFHTGSGILCVFERGAHSFLNFSYSCFYSF